MNNPLKYTDPSGHYATFDNGGGEVPNPPPPQAQIPEVIEVTPGLQVIIMPESYEPNPVDQGLAHDLGYVNGIVDIGEAASAVSVLLGNAPGAGLQYFLSGGDILVAGTASYFAGETGILRLDESLPPMLGVGQDPIVTTGEALAIPPVQIGLTIYGFSSGSIPGAMTGLILAQELDIGTSALSAAYDIARAEGTIPQVISVAFYWDNNASTQIPLPGAPSGQPVLAIIIYQ
jgi:hypothetical protein